MIIKVNYNLILLFYLIHETNNPLISNSNNFDHYHFCTCNKLFSFLENMLFVKRDKLSYINFL